MHFYFPKNEFERDLVALALGTKNPREDWKIGFGGETIHPSWSWREDHSNLFTVLHL
jgi:hypothetical protein